MKKFLLSLAALAIASSVSATSYVLINSDNRGEWTGGADGWTTTVVAGGHSFTLSTAKESSTATDLISPANNPSWRVYKGTSVSIESADFVMKTVIVNFDEYDYNGTTYFSELTLSSGWTGSLNGCEYTLTSSGLKSIKMTAETKQVRIKSIVVSDEVGSTEPPVGPELPEGVVYKNDFTESLDGWVKINDESLSDFNGWKINNNPKCAICNSYYAGVNHAANAKMQHDLDLSNRENCRIVFEQAFGYDFPQQQVENYRVYIINYDDNAETLNYLTLTNFPAAPSKNWSDWAENEFDISEWDGCRIALGFEYATDGQKSRAWEIKNLVVYGDATEGAVDTIGADSNVAATYYNLQGVRVNNPENGLFIVVKGGKSQKVVF